MAEPNVRLLQKMVIEQRTENESLKRRLEGGGDPPHDGDMEQRVAKLETDVGEIKSILGRLEPLIIRIDERLNHLPSKGYVVTTVVTIVGLVIAAIAAAPYLRVVPPP